MRIIYIYIYICICTYTCTHTHMFASIMCIYIYTHIYIYIHAWIDTYMHLDRHVRFSNVNLHVCRRHAPTVCFALLKIHTSPAVQTMICDHAFHARFSILVLWQICWLGASQLLADRGSKGCSRSSTWRPVSSRVPSAGAALSWQP